LNFDHKETLRYEVIDDRLIVRKSSGEWSLLSYVFFLARINNSDYVCSIFTSKFKVIVPILRAVVLRYQILRRVARQSINNKGESVFDNRMIKWLFSQLGNHQYLQRYFST
jgi:hypothetical protein